MSFEIQHSAREFFRFKGFQPIFSILLILTLIFILQRPKEMKLPLSSLPREIESASSLLCASLAAALGLKMVAIATILISGATGVEIPLVSRRCARCRPRPPRTPTTRPRSGADFGSRGRRHGCRSRDARRQLRRHAHVRAEAPQ